MSRGEDELRTVVERLSPVARQLLRRMQAGKSYSASELQLLIGESTKARAVGAVGWLIANGLARESTGEQRTTYVSLASKGQLFLKGGGLPEERIIELLRERGSFEVQKLCEELSISKDELNPILGRMKRENILNFGAGGRIVLGESLAVTEAETRYRLINDLLVLLQTNQKVDWQTLTHQQRKIIEEMSRKRGKSKAVFRVAQEVEMSYELTPRGQQAQVICRDSEDIEEIDRLTPEHLERESWRGRVFRKYDIETKPKRLRYGRKHPYGAFLDFVRGKLIGMGFEEMGGRIVETEFWNNDALFMPQDHPAREIHDVYLVREPKHSDKLPQGLVDKVASTHEDGWKTGSSGWGYKFDRKRTARFVLKSQGTANSARMLASGPKIPGKYFAIARCFRYDRVDATHAPDFYQIEGIVLSPDINFRHLLGLLKLFALEIAGSEEVRFTPSYFPFTEPSVEVQFKHKELGWMELGGAGIFRKEVTLPLGIEVPVIAWGLGLDRMAMVALSVNDIRDLFSSDLAKIDSMRFKVI